MVKKLSCVSCGSLKRFPHTFTTLSYRAEKPDSHLCKDYKGGGGNQNLGGQFSS